MEFVNKSHARYPHVYAIVRFDSDMTGLENMATVVKVFEAQIPAEKEAARLQELNKGKSCIYKVQITRFIGIRP